MENKTKTNNQNSFQHNEEEKAKIAKIALAVLWITAIIFGLGFNLWFLFFVAVAITIAHLFGGSKFNNDNNSYSKKWYHDPSYSSLSGNDWHNIRNSNRR